MSNPKYSHSMLSTYRACALKFKLKYQDKLVPIQPESRHDADYGNAWHAGLAEIHRGRPISAAHEAFAADYPKTNYPDPLPVRSQGKSFSNGLMALTGYARRWAEDDAYWQVLHVEERNTDDSDKILKLDLIVEDKRDGQVYGIDHKTTSSYLDNNYWSRFEPDSQIRFYADYVKSKFGHCGGFYINAVSFKHRSKAYTPRTGSDKGVQQPAGDWFSFARMCFNPNTACLQLERDNFDYWVGRIEADRASGDWGYNDQSCHQYGRECEYLKLCSAGYTWPQDEELILGYYKQACPRVLPEGRCQLSLGHEGEHDATVVTQDDYEVESEEVENAVS